MLSVGQTTIVKTTTERSNLHEKKSGQGQVSVKRQGHLLPAQYLHPHLLQQLLNDASNCAVILHLLELTASIVPCCLHGTQGSNLSLENLKLLCQLFIGDRFCCHGGGSSGNGVIHIGGGTCVCKGGEGEERGDEGEDVAHT